MSREWMIWWIPQVPGVAYRCAVPDLTTATILTKALAEYDLFQYENNIKPDYCNAGGIMWREPGGEWEDFDPEFDDLTDTGNVSLQGDPRDEHWGGSHERNTIGADDYHMEPGK